MPSPNARYTCFGCGKRFPETAEILMTVGDSKKSFCSRICIANFGIYMQDTHASCEGCGREVLFSTADGYNVCSERCARRLMSNKSSNICVLCGERLVQFDLYVLNNDAYCRTCFYLSREQLLQRDKLIKSKPSPWPPLLPELPDINFTIPSFLEGPTWYGSINTTSNPEYKDKLAPEGPSKLIEQIREVSEMLAVMPPLPPSVDTKEPEPEPSYIESRFSNLDFDD